MNMIKKLLFGAGLLTVLMTVASCSKNSSFCVKGVLAEAKDSTLYFESLGLNGVEMLDSVVLDEKGAFSFSGERMPNPEFYRLRVADKVINLAVDSTETIEVEANFRNNMPVEYVVRGSETNERIKALAVMQMALQRNVHNISVNKNLNSDEKEAQLEQLLEGYKQKVMADYIVRDPASAASYFAVFQTIGPYLIFDPVRNALDVRCVGAVATAWDERYPGTVRTENLHNIALEGLKNTRKPRVNTVTLDESKVKEVGLIDIELPDMNGETRSLSALKGKVVLLDFTAYSASNSTQHIMLLRDLYNKYKSEGFEIYQVSLDTDEHFWKTSCKRLPWICVSTLRSNRDYTTLYRVEEIPTYFLINRDNSVYLRGDVNTDLEASIKQLL
jgi:hypothetical protein